MIHLTELIQTWERKRYYRGKKYGLIRRNASDCGLFSFFIVFLGGIDKCIREGLIPVIDMQTCGNPYLEDKQVGKENAWEFYFQQPMGITMKQFDMSEAAVIDADEDVPEAERPNIDMKFLTDADKVQYWRDVCKKYIKFSAETQSILTEKRKMLLESRKGKKLGILCRGTDYVSLKPAGHPVQPDVEEVLAKAKCIMQEKGCESVFLATEDADILRRFQAEFGEKVIVNKSDRFSETGNRYLAEIMREQKVDRYENGLNYLTTIYLLSQCDYLLAGRVSGLLGALLLAESFGYQYFWDYGVY